MPEELQIDLRKLRIGTQAYWLIALLGVVVSGVLAILGLYLWALGVFIVFSPKIEDWCAVLRSSP